MPIIFKLKLLFYADDSVLIVSGFDPREIADELSRKLKSLTINCLCISLWKTEAILFGPKIKLIKCYTLEVKCGEINLANVNTVKYLELL